MNRLKKKKWLVFLFCFLCIAGIAYVVFPVYYIMPSLDSLEGVWRIKENEKIPFNVLEIKRRADSTSLYVKSYPHFQDSYDNYWLVADFSDDFYISQEVEQCRKLGEIYEKWSQDLRRDAASMKRKIGIDFDKNMIKFDSNSGEVSFPDSFCSDFNLPEKKMDCAVYFHFSNDNCFPYEKRVFVLNLGKGRWRLYVLLHHVLGPNEI